MELTSGYHTLSEGWVDVVVPVRLRRGAYPGRYEVHHAETDQHLGWTVKVDGLWRTYASSGAYQQHVLDRVPESLARLVEVSTKREDGLAELAHHLVETRAPALGYGPHYRVHPYRPGR
jgi:hypothetical protein